MQYPIGALESWYVQRHISQGKLTLHFPGLKPCAVSVWIQWLHDISIGLKYSIKTVYTKWENRHFLYKNVDRGGFGSHSYFEKSLLFPPGHSAVLKRTPCQHKDFSLHDRMFSPMPTPKSVSGFSCSPEQIQGLTSCRWGKDKITLHQHSSLHLCNCFVEPHP